MGGRWKIDDRRREGCGPGMPGPYGGRRGKRVLVERFAGGVNFPTTTKEERRASPLLIYIAI